MIKPHIPEYKELLFRRRMLADPDTMSYNHAWGGTIDWPESCWRDWYTQWVLCSDGTHYYRYLQNEEGAFVGEIAFHFDELFKLFLADVIVYAPFRGRGYGREGLDILCGAAKAGGLEALYDDIAIDNPSVDMFIKAGFTEEYRTNNFIMLKKTLD